GRAPLAQHLQRTGRLPEAADEWKRVVSGDSRDATAALALARVYEQMGQRDLAIATCLRLIEAAPTARNYLTVAQRLEQLAESENASGEIRIALVGNATLDQLASYLRVECFRAVLRPV